MFRAMEMKRMESERELLEKSIIEFFESQSKEILDAIVTCFEEDPTKNDGRKIYIDKFTSFVFDYGKIMTILMNNKDFAEKVIKAMDDRLNVLNNEFDLANKVRYGGGSAVIKGIANLNVFRKCISEGGKKMENKNKSFDDLIEVVNTAVKKGYIEGYKLEKGNVARVLSYWQVDYVESAYHITERDFDYTDTVNDILSLGEDHFIIEDIDSLQKVKEGATGVLANREKFSVVRDHTKYGGSDALGISFETKDIVNLPLTVLMGATIKQERD